METKPAPKTSEFWFTLIVGVLTWLTTVADNADVVNVVPDKYRYVLNSVAMLATALLAGLYTIGRGKAKQGVAYNPDATS